jgi:RNA polymerase sigma factor (sigma-70 family)
MKQTDAGSPRLWSVVELGAFFVENRHEFLAHAKRVTRSHSEAEEIVQDSLVRVLLACPELESVEHARSYFHRVIENLSIDMFRRQDRQPRLVVLDDVKAELESQWITNPDFADSLGAVDDAAIIREAISYLSPAERAALVMWEFEGRSTSEIALELGIKETSVRHTLSRARSGLRRILSEQIIDQSKGLTALDLLSISYRKAEKVVQKSSKLALSFVLLVTAFLGLNSLTAVDFAAVQSAGRVEQFVDAKKPADVLRDSGGDLKLGQSDRIKETGVQSQPPLTEAKSGQRQFSTQPKESFFAGLDAEGLPSGFTITDTSGKVGILFSGQQRSIATESGLLASNIVSTRSGAVNVLIDQSVILDSFGTSYVARVLVGINGGWQPLNLSHISVEVTRVASGNYLLTANMMVDSVVQTSVRVPSSTAGIDLTAAPDFVTTRLLLDQTKTKILAQAVLVSADSQGNGA